MSDPEDMDLRRFVREYHVHYDARSETAAGSADGRSAGVEVRLFASHDGAPLSTPTCERCHALREDLRRFAQHLTSIAGPTPPPEIEIIPDPSALYTAKDDPRRDEVMLTIRVTAPEGQDEPFVSQLQHELAAVGAGRQG